MYVIYMFSASSSKSTSLRQAPNWARNTEEKTESACLHETCICLGGGGFVSLQAQCTSHTRGVEWGHPTPISWLVSSPETSSWQPDKRLNREFLLNRSGAKTNSCNFAATSLHVYKSLMRRVINYFLSSTRLLWPLAQLALLRLSVRVHRVRRRGMTGCILLCLL